MPQVPNNQGYDEAHEKIEQADKEYDTMRIVMLYFASFILGAILMHLLEGPCACAQSTQVSPVVLPQQEPSKPLWTAVEEGCLARTVYGEARNQDPLGQLAVAAVVLNRSLSPNWPNDVCDVVTQKYQFAGYKARITPNNEIERQAWAYSQHVAHLAITHYGQLGDLRGLVFFDKHPKHPVGMFAFRIGDHNFYRLHT